MKEKKPIKLFADDNVICNTVSIEFSILDPNQVME